MSGLDWLSPPSGLSDGDDDHPHEPSLHAALGFSEGEAARLRDRIFFLDDLREVEQIASSTSPSVEALSDALEKICDSLRSMSSDDMFVAARLVDSLDTLGSLEALAESARDEGQPLTSICAVLSALIARPAGLALVLRHLSVDDALERWTALLRGDDTASSSVLDDAAFYVALGGERCDSPLLVASMLNSLFSAASIFALAYAPDEPMDRASSLLALLSALPVPRSVR